MAALPQTIYILPANTTDYSGFDRFERMQHFFFDLVEDGVLSLDDSGVELASDEFAIIEAKKAVLEMAFFSFSKIQEGTLAIAVRDQSGAHVCTITLALSCKNCSDQ